MSAQGQVVEVRMTGEQRGTRGRSQRAKVGHTFRVGLARCKAGEDA